MKKKLKSHNKNNYSPSDDKRIFDTVEGAKEQDLEMNVVYTALADENNVSVSAIKQRYYKLRDRVLPRRWEEEEVVETEQPQSILAIFNSREVEKEETQQPQAIQEEVEQPTVQEEETKGDETQDSDVSEQEGVPELRKETSSMVERIAIIVAERDHYKEKYEELLAERQHMSKLLGL